MLKNGVRIMETAQVFGVRKSTICLIWDSETKIKACEKKVIFSVTRWKEWGIDHYSWLRQEAYWSVPFNGLIIRKKPLWFCKTVYEEQKQRHPAHLVLDGWIGLECIVSLIENGRVTNQRYERNTRALLQQSTDEVASTSQDPNLQHHITSIISLGLV